VQVIGAGLPRTGTMSLKAALERLTGRPCYHMLELFERPDDLPVWHRAVQGERFDWDALLGAYGAAVDWPASAFWPALRAQWPEATVLLSLRDDAEQWWRSADRTVMRPVREGTPEGSEMRHEMVRGLVSQLSPDWDDPAAMKAAYDRHADEVRRSVPADRLVEWRPQDGWGPLCAALGVDAPDEPFPHTNTTEEFRARFDAATG
jgi:hypothetical protein